MFSLALDNQNYSLHEESTTNNRIIDHAGLSGARKLLTLCILSGRNRKESGRDTALRTLDKLLLLLTQEKKYHRTTDTTTAVSFAHLQAESFVFQTSRVGVHLDLLTSPVLVPHSSTHTSTAASTPVLRQICAYYQPPTPPPHDGKTHAHTFVYREMGVLLDVYDEV